LNEASGRDFHQIKCYLQEEHFKNVSAELEIFSPIASSSLRPELENMECYPANVVTL